jgi:hypothetical protein
MFSLSIAFRFVIRHFIVVEMYGKGNWSSHASQEMKGKGKEEVRVPKSPTRHPPNNLISIHWNLSPKDSICYQ